jgi:ABC-type nitrate/sulfonate/bicarbonate transport system substrate-binding protein
VTAVLAACGGDDETSAGGSSSGGSGLQGVDYQLAWLKSMQFVGQFMALEMGYYADNGIEVNQMAGGPTVDAITVVSSGEALVGLADSNEIAVARGTGVPVKAIAAAFQKSPFALISLAEDPLETLEAQYGMTVAVSDSSRPTVEALMERQGLDPGEVQFVPKSPDPSVLADGQVQGYWGFISSEAAVLDANGVDVVSVLLADLGETTQANVLFASDETLESNRDLIVSLLKADIAGWQHYVDNVEEAAGVVFDSYAEGDSSREVMVAEGQAQVALVNDGDAVDRGLLWVSAEVMEQNIASAVESGLLDEEYPVEDVLTTDYIEEAHA